MRGAIPPLPQYIFMAWQRFVCRPTSIFTRGTETSAWRGVASCRLCIELALHLTPRNRALPGNRPFAYVMTCVAQGDPD